MSFPPEEPTRRLPAQGAVPPPGIDPREPTIVAEDPAWRHDLLARLDGLRTGLVIVGLIALLALGLAAWTFLRERDDRTSGRSGPGSAQVEDLREQVDDLDARLENRATTGDLAELQQSEQKLAQRVDDLAGEATDKPAPASSTDAQARDGLSQLDDTVSTLAQSVTDLDERVQALEDQAGQQSP